MKKKDRQRLEDIIANLCTLKYEISQLKKSESEAIERAKHMEARSVLRGNEIDMEDALNHLFRGIGKLKRIRITI